MISRFPYSPGRAAHQYNTIELGADMRPLGKLIQNSKNHISSLASPNCYYLLCLLLVSLSLLLLSSFCLVSFDHSKVESSRLMVQQLGEVHVRQEEISHRAGVMGLKSAAEAAHQYIKDDCNGRRIYMYNLPEEFNTRILQQCGSEIVDWLNFCPHVQHHGFGRLATADSWADWYETDPYMLEVIFHSRMASYPCTTQVPHQADAFFIPYYSGLDALHYLYGKRKRKWREHGLSLVKWLQENHGGEHWRRRGGHDHFIVMGRTAWDFTRTAGSRLIAEHSGGHEEEGGWGTGFASLPEMRNVTALFLEGRPWQALEQAIPYPTGFHPSSLQNLRAWQQKVQTANRTFLMAFVGAPRPLQTCTSELHRNMRQAAIDQCAGNTTACSLLDCSKMKCAHASVPIAERLLDAHFCLQPPGDTVTRRSTFDSLLSGCIPVFFLNDTAYNQYTWHLSGLHPSSYSVFVPGRQLHRLLPLLSSYSAKRIAHMRTYIVQHLITRIIYAGPQLAASHPFLPDAFQLTLDNMLRRSAALIHGS